MYKKKNKKYRVPSPYYIYGIPVIMYTRITRKMYNNNNLRRGREEKVNFIVRRVVRFLNACRQTYIQPLINKYTGVRNIVLVQKYTTDFNIYIYIHIYAQR